MSEDQSVHYALSTSPFCIHGIAASNPAFSAFTCVILPRPCLCSGAASVCSSSLSHLQHCWSWKVRAWQKLRHVLLVSSSFNSMLVCLPSFKPLLSCTPAIDSSAYSAFSRIMIHSTFSAWQLLDRLHHLSWGHCWVFFLSSGYHFLKPNQTMSTSGSASQSRGNIRRTSAPPVRWAPLFYTQVGLGRFYSITMPKSSIYMASCRRFHSCLRTSNFCCNNNILPKAIAPPLGSREFPDRCAIRAHTVTLDIKYHPFANDNIDVCQQENATR